MTISTGTSTGGLVTSPSYIILLDCYFSQNYAVGMFSYNRKEVIEWVVSLAITHQELLKEDHTGATCGTKTLLSAKR